jgi:hypothetical protein
LINSNIAKKEDLGMDFGTGEKGIPSVDKDLEEEINPKDLMRSDKKTNIKSGIDVNVKGSKDNMFVEAD